MKKITEGVAQIQNTVDIKKEPEVEGQSFETQQDKARMDYDVAREKARFERIPRSGGGDSVEHHRRAVGLRRRFVEGVNSETDGWKALPKGLIEAAKQVMKKSSTIPVPKQSEEGFESQVKGNKHPHIIFANEPNKKKVPE